MTSWKAGSRRHMTGQAGGRHFTRKGSGSATSETSVPVAGSWSLESGAQLCGGSVRDSH